MNRLTFASAVFAACVLFAPSTGWAQLCTCDAQCDDGNTCTEDECCEGSCQNNSLPAGSSCDDGVPCTENDVCGPTGGGCSGTLLDCSHLDNDCNVGGCNLITGACEATPTNEGGPCDDGLFCTVGDYCAAGTCAANPRTCDDGDPCTDDFCLHDVECMNDPIEGCCESDAECDDGVFCNGQEWCNLTLLECQPGTPPDGQPCDDGLFCTMGDSCAKGACAGTARDCGDGDPCTADECDEEDGVCVNTSIEGCCSSDAECDDGVFCNGPEFCGTGMVCQPGIPPDGQPCDEGLFCTVGETCASGVCSGGSPRSCDDGDPCTTDSCDEEEGDCDYEPIEPCCITNEECDDGNPCTGDICNPLNQCENPPLPIGTPCGDQGTTGCSNPDTCDAAGMCQANHTNEGGPCDDDDACTDSDICRAGICRGAPNGLCETCVQGADPGDPTSEISFQAKLVGVAGGRIGDPTVDLEFQFYDAAGLPVGSSIPVNDVPCIDWGDGHCGVSTDIPVTETLFGNAVLLGVSVNGTPELTPRIMVGTVPQAFRVGCATGEEISDSLKLGGADARGELRIVGPDPNPGTSRGDPVWDYATIQTKSTSLEDNCGQALLIDDVGTTVDLSGCDTLEAFGMDFAVGGGLRLYNATNYQNTIELQAGSGIVPSTLSLRDQTGNKTVSISGNGVMGLRNAAGEFQSFFGRGYLTLYQENYPDIGVALDGDNAGAGGQIRVRNASNKNAVVVSADHNDAGRIVVKNADGKGRVYIEGHHKSNDGSYILLKNDSGTSTLSLRGHYGGGGRLLVTNSSGNNAVDVRTDNNNAGQIILKNEFGEGRIYIEGRQPSHESSYILMKNIAGTSTLSLRGDWGGGGRINVTNRNGKSAVDVRANHHDAGQIIVKNDEGDARVVIEAQHTDGGSPYISLTNAMGTGTIFLYGDYGSNNKGRIRTDILRIQGGSDLSEQFDISGPTGDVKPGMVVSIDPKRPGKLVLSREAYERRVAGIISGAGGVEPGMLMGQAGSVADGEHPVALSGRVYVWADASSGPIEPGDLLTSSDTPGHAMKVTDYGRAQGAIIGKAMTSLSEGKGLVLVLVSLQ